jgi:hypothetical protein
MVCTLDGMEDELIELLGGGDEGRSRLARIRRRAKGRDFTGRCHKCGKLYLAFEFAALAPLANCGERIAPGIVCVACRGPAPWH